MNKKLYWTDAEDNDIEVLDPQTGHRKVLISTGNNSNPRAIVVDPRYRQAINCHPGLVPAAANYGK